MNNFTKESLAAVRIESVIIKLAGCITYTTHDII